jgi:AcrR family transcriptional regulator
MGTELSPYDEKLNSILGEAARIFAEKGYHNASIRDIARATGVSLSGLYYYFQGKEELLYLIQNHTFTILLSGLEERLSSTRDPQLRFRHLVENHLTYFVSNMAEMKVISHEADSLGGEYRQRVNAQKRRLVEVTATVLRGLRPDGDFDQRAATFALFGMINWLYTWYRPGRDVPVDRLVDEISRIFLYGYLDAATSASDAPVVASASIG